SGDLGMNGGGGATDADEDMAFALLMADKQWGGKSAALSDTYYNYAKKEIAAIWLHEVVDSKLAGPGDHWADQWNNINISYFAPSYYRLFQKVTVTDTPGWPSGAPAPDWNAVVKTAYDTIDFALKPDFGNQNNGLVPAWCASHDPICSPNNGDIYQYDSCRTPFRIGLDWCWNGEPRAQAYVTKTSNFFSGLGGVANIADGYALNGNPQPANPGKGSAAFVGPAAVGAMSAATYRTFLDQAYSAVATRQLLAGGTYYEESWTVMSLLMMTGNFI